ncbi:unnamed protein product, partial [Gulo gulo]
MGGPRSEQAEGPPRVPHKPGGDCPVQCGVRYQQPHALRDPGHPGAPENPPGPAVQRVEARRGAPDPARLGLDPPGLYPGIRAAGRVGEGAGSLEHHDWRGRAGRPAAVPSLRGDQGHRGAHGHPGE